MDFVSTECWGISESVLSGCQGILVYIGFSLIFFSFNFLYIALHFVNNVLGKISTFLKTVLKRLVHTLSLSSDFRSSKALSLGYFPFNSSSEEPPKRLQKVFFFVLNFRFWFFISTFFSFYRGCGQ